MNTLNDIRTKQAEIKKSLEESENNLANIWNDIFHKPQISSLSSPTGKAIAFLSNSAGIIDGAILGWKLYRKFGGLFSNKNKKKK